MPESMDLSVVIPALDEEGAIASVVTGVLEEAGRLGLRCEVIVVDGGSKDDTVRKAESAGARVLPERGLSFGEAVRAGARAARAPRVLLMDGDGSHSPAALPAFWARREADLVIGSRLVEGGGASMPLLRRLLTRVLSRLSRALLRLPVADSSSGYRLYRAEILSGLRTRAAHFDFQQESLLQIVRGGGKVEEVPIYYRWRREGRSKARFLATGRGYLRTVLRAWTNAL